MLPRKEKNELFNKNNVHKIRSGGIGSFDVDCRCGFHRSGGLHNARSGTVGRQYPGLFKFRNK